MWSPSRAAVLRAHKRRSAVQATINLWPFVAVEIVLLIVFMLYTPPPHFHLWASRALPRSVNAIPQPTALREDAIRISVSRDGNVFYRNTQVQPQELPEMIRDSLKNGSEKKVYIAVDRRTRSRDAAIVWDQIRLSGIERVCFIAEQSLSR